MRTEELVVPSRCPGVQPPGDAIRGRPEGTASARAPFRVRRIWIGGRALHYIDEGAGPPLLFVDVGAGSVLWQGVIVRLRDRFRCVALDLPESTPQRILESFVGRLDFRDMTLVLHDLGGPVVLGIAPRLNDRIRALVVAESFGWPLGDANPELASGIGPARDPIPASWNGALSEHDLRGVDRTLRTLLKDRPLLLVFGEESPAVRAGVPERWRERFPDAGLLLVEGGDRSPMTHAPDLVARAIRGWFREEVLAA